MSFADDNESEQRQEERRGTATAIKAKSALAGDKTLAFWSYLVRMMNSAVEVIGEVSVLSHLVIGRD